MDSERTHRSSTGELFICFTSRFSSSTSNHSSMKISSKSILSPGRTDKFREPQISLSSSLSRRLRSNGSMKGGQASPMFPAAGKKRGGAFENPEPSSPKVTCIGQVRVKTKKGKKLRSRSKRRGEVSFRKIEHTVEGAVVHQGGHGHHLQTQQECLPHRNQRWVHLPLTICEALRAFGADFNCFLPCRSSCTSGEREKEEKGAGESSGGGCAGSSSCGAVFARWLVALQEGEKGREIELVVGEDEKAGEGFHRRHVLDDIEFKLEEDEAKDGIVDGEEARVSICIPPKNALLLMRCRSDPMRMAALTNKFWEPPLPQEEEEDEDEDEDEDEEDARNEQEQVDMYTDAVEEQEGEEEEEEEEEGGDTESKVEPETKPELLDEVLEKRVSVEEIEEENSTTVSEQRTTFVTEKEEEEEQDDQGDAPERNPEIIELDQEENQEKEEEEVTEEAAQGQEEEAEELLKTGFCLDPLVGSGSVENEEIELTQLVVEQEEQEEEEGNPAFPPDRRPSISSPPPPVPVNSEPGKEDTPATEALPEDDEEEEIATVESKESEKSMVSETEEEEETAATHARPDFEQEDQKAWEETDKDEGGQKSSQRETQPNPKGGAGVLPDCLLLMMCEPKLSMEVSRETWVCSTDFVRWHPDKPVKPTNGPDQPKTRLSTDSNPSQQQQQHHHHHHHHHLQPPRSSCSFPAAAGVSMATMIEQKLVNAKAYEPFVLTRCKSEPMRSSAKLAPDPCFWKNRKLEPHRPRVGAAGVGF